MFGFFIKSKIVIVFSIILGLAGGVLSQTPDQTTKTEKDTSQTVTNKTGQSRVFEIRTYTIAQKWDVYMPFFTGTTMELFKKHGFEPVGFWIPQDAPGSENTLIYILAFPNRETANKKWEAFFNDPKWKQDRAAFIARYGKITDNIESKFVSPVDFSPIK